jgi:hypothetical protein
MPHVTLSPGIGASVLFSLTAVTQRVTTLDRFTDPPRWN